MKIELEGGFTGDRASSIKAQARAETSFTAPVI